ncbi:hypothetical protein FDECE_2663 [Fusarium decemcellulare]|nr:hypothetical protein FDECE_2663 [Fusarium decemcellulare]
MPPVKKPGRRLSRTVTSGSASLRQKKARPATSSSTKRRQNNKDGAIRHLSNRRQLKELDLLPSPTASQKKWSSWMRHSDFTPFPDFPRPTSQECEAVHRLLLNLHGDAVKENFSQDDELVPKGQYTSVMDALVVAALSQATSWSNAKRAMNNMRDVYGSTFAYDAIVNGGIDKVRDALWPGGMQKRKSKILMGLLQDVKTRHRRWDLQHLLKASDTEVSKEMVSYWGLGLGAQMRPLPDEHLPEAGQICCRYTDLSSIGPLGLATTGCQCGVCTSTS